MQSLVVGSCVFFNHSTSISSLNSPIGASMPPAFRFLALCFATPSSALRFAEVPLLSLESKIAAGGDMRADELPAMPDSCIMLLVVAGKLPDRLRGLWARGLEARLLLLDFAFIAFGVVALLAIKEWPIREVGIATGAGEFAREAEAEGD